MLFRTGMVWCTLSACSDMDGAGGEPDRAAPADTVDGDRTALSLSDVAILFPLPFDDAGSGLWAAADAGADGPLLPLAVVAELPPLVPQPVERVHERLRVVSVRVDPCAPAPEGGCSAEVRLVYGLWLDARRGVEDLGVHTTHSLSDAAMDEVIAGLRALRLEHGGADRAAPLGVHPVLQAQGLEGAYAEGLQAVVAGSLRSADLSRVTFMTLEGPHAWDFGVFDVVRGEMSPMWIPGGGEAAGVQVQEVTAPPGGTTLRVRSGGSALLDDQAMMPFLDARALAGASAAAVDAGVARALRLEDPHDLNGNTTPCVGCHIATQALDAVAGDRGLDLSDDPRRFRSAFNTTLTHSASLDMLTPDRFMPMRALGYQGRTPTFTQRAVNDAAATLEYLGEPDP
jgi:hypothetical protein